MTQSITLRSGLTGSSSGLRHMRDTLKLQARALFYRRHSRDWLRLLNSSALLRELAGACPGLVNKIYRPYLSGTMDCRRRLAVLTEHYRFIAQRGLGPLVAQAARKPVVLGEISGKSGAAYQLQLRAIGEMEREGELVLQLTGAGAVIYSVAFSFLSAEHRMSVGIGCMQGPQGSDGLALVREATRDLHGLRPKNLMVRLVSQLGRDYDCQAVLLVGNPNRAVHHSARKGKVHADYDALWLEMGAYARGDGDFELPCEDLAAPVMEEIASKKRSEARKRFETLEALVAVVRAGLRAPRGAAPPARAEAPPPLARDAAMA
ncbi:VirK/YbjX family protein [Janthinobacterium sp.]|uniref:VirK/YbjX family protein n=1 Tax=Janthinobacterium sp. TaxID=1871054 RepID=UPI00293D9E77|nr:VirK/YbjX family protein [Janthinobacterium sp.]